MKHDTDRTQFLDVKDFLNKMASDEQLMASAKKVKFLQSKSKGDPIRPPERKHDSGCSPSLLKLWESLPPKPYCDKLISKYFQYFERTMRVLHRPTFMRQYQRLWLDSGSGLDFTSSILALLTSVMTRAYLLDDTARTNEADDYRAYLRGAAINHIQAWLGELGRKQRTELSTLQVELLVLLSGSVSHSDPDRIWSRSGAIMRSAMTMGLHIDPAKIKHLSPYQMEMRKRLWASVLETEVQVSIMTGMPLVIPELGSYCPVPANLYDEDFDESSSKLPPPRPLCDLTDSLYQIYLAMSLPHRIRASSLVHRSIPDVGEAIEIGREIQRSCCSLPLTLSLQHSQPATGDRGGFLHRILLDFYLRRSLLCLYRPLLFDYQDYQGKLAPADTL